MTKSITSDSEEVKKRLMSNWSLRRKLWYRVSFFFGNLYVTWQIKRSKK